MSFVHVFKSVSFLYRHKLCVFVLYVKHSWKKKHSSQKLLLIKKSTLKKLFTQELTYTILEVFPSCHSATNIEPFTTVYYNVLHVS